MLIRSSRAIAAAVALSIGLSTVPALAGVPPMIEALEKDAAACQKAIGKAGQKFKSADSKAWRSCLDSTLRGKTCDADKRDAAIDTARGKARATIEAKCTNDVIFAARPAGVAFPQTCALKLGADSPAEMACAALPVTDVGTLADCLLCWKDVEIRRLVDLLYPCLEGTVPDGSPLECGTAPLACPTDKAESSCVSTIAGAELTAFLAREKALEGCLNSIASGKSTTACPDTATNDKIAKADAKKTASLAKCGAKPSWWDVCPADPSETCDQDMLTLTDIDTCASAASLAAVTGLVCQQYPMAATSGLICPVLPACGDGAVNTPAEECDDDNLDDEDGCNANCEIEDCGDGVLQVGLGEACDDGDANSDSTPDACRTDCQLHSCGDGVVDSDEECEGSADGCNPSSCTICGNGIVSGPEACDTMGAACPAPTEHFTTPGSSAWTVPTGVTEVTFDVRGAQGGDGNIGGAGGLGGETSALLTVVPGTTYQIVVGGSGADAQAFTEGFSAGGFNGGGDGGSRGVAGANGSGGGGGASDVRAGACAAGQTCTLADRVLVAGGGGGGGANCSGGIEGGDGGGTTGADGDDDHCDPAFGGYGGEGGTQSAGGAGGAVGAFGTSGTAGALGVGGVGGNAIGGGTGGGGGGGGYYGGGGGGATSGGGGGGGSGYADPGLALVEPATLTSGVKANDGEVVITLPAPVCSSTCTCD